MNVFVLYPCLESSERLEFHELRPQLWTEWTPDAKSFLEEALRQCKIRLGTSKDQVFYEVKSVIWHAITLQNYKSIIDNEVSTSKTPNIILSVLDGNEKDGWPGVSVIEYLDQLRLLYTGCSPSLYSVDVDKSRAKVLLPPELTPKFAQLTAGSKVSIEENTMIVQERDGAINLRLPVLLKPAFSSGSVGITDKSLIRSSQDLKNLPTADYYFEEYISGREFTCFVIGTHETGVVCLNPVERVFAKDLESDKKFLSFDRKWNGWLTEWWYEPSNEPEVIKKVQEVAKKVFTRLQGNGYCRMDMRMDGDKVYVVDLNSNPSLDGQEDTALGNILKSTRMPSGDWMKLSDLLELIFQHALMRFSSFSQ